MSASTTGNPAKAGVSFADLLAYNNSEVLKWKAWFEKNPAALDVNIGGRTGTIRELVKHIFQAENILAARIFEEEVDKSALEPKDDREMWALHDRGYARLSAYAASASEAEMARIVTLPFGGGRKVSTRKLMAQAALHNVHHWAQVAIEVRQAGMPSEGPHDILLTDAMV